MTFRCISVRSRIDAYLDGALPEEARQGVSRHLEACAECAETARRQQRFALLVRAAADSPALEPDWTGFWHGVRSRLVAERPVAHRRGWSAAPMWPLGWAPRLALGSVLAAALVVALILGGGDPDMKGAGGMGVIVNGVEVENPNASVMVLSNPAQDFTVIWVFGLESSPEQSLWRPDAVRDGWAARSSPALS